MGCGVSKPASPKWAAAPPRATVFPDACPDELEEWVLSRAVASAWAPSGMKRSGTQHVAAFRLDDGSELPGYGIYRVGRGKFHVCACDDRSRPVRAQPPLVAIAARKPQVLSSALVDMTWENERWHVEKAAQRAIDVATAEGGRFQVLKHAEPAEGKHQIEVDGLATVEGGLRALPVEWSFLMAGPPHTNRKMRLLVPEGWTALMLTGAANNWLQGPLGDPRADCRLSAQGFYGASTSDHTLLLAWMFLPQEISSVSRDKHVPAEVPLRSSWGDPFTPTPELQASYKAMVDAPVGVRLRSSLPLTDRLALLAACAACAPWLLEGCELSLSTDYYRTLSNSEDASGITQDAPVLPDCTCEFCAGELFDTEHGQRKRRQLYPQQEPLVFNRGPGPSS